MEDGQIIDESIKKIFSRFPSIYCEEEALKYKKQLQKTIRLQGVNQFYLSSWCSWIKSIHMQCQAWSSICDEKLGNYTEDISILNRYSHKAYGWYAKGQKNGIAKEYKEAMERVGFEFSDRRVCGK